ncbi:MAG: sulfatase-like hydrolase/transferase [Planctomycetes bacterium]|nr:sulfatase-like hydrolase/transferase [Planctomycetota bacterium]
MQSRRAFLKTVAAGAVAMSFAAPAITTAANNKKRPNVILIMADDMGYECVGANGCTSYKTPNLDRMARSGVRFEHCYSQPICSPSRVQIMTGIYNNRNYTQWGTLPKTETTFGHIMQRAGYATACAGKWQLSNDGVTAKKAGFDETCMWAYGFDLEGFKLKYPLDTPDNYYYNPNKPSERYYCIVDDRPHMTSRYWRPCVLRNGRLVPTTFDDYAPDICTDFLVDFIESQKAEPFFIYYPMILTHGPNVPTPDSKGVKEMLPAQKLKSDKKYFKDMVEYADKLVGRILDKLEHLGIRDNTIVMFTGDNGTIHGIETQTEDGTITGGKGMTTNAGTHVPLITSWRGLNAKGADCGDLVDFSDFFMTIAHASGATLPEGTELDGHSFLPQICGKKSYPRQYVVAERDWVFCHYDKNPSSAMPNPKFPRARFARDKRLKLYDNGRLYDVSKDPLEEHIIDRDKWPEKRRQLQEVLNSMYVKPDFYTQGGVTRENNLK